MLVDPSWWDLLDVFLVYRLLCLEVKLAPWLPWYRRYLSAMPWVLNLLLVPTHPGDRTEWYWNMLTFLVSIGIASLNLMKAKDNLRNGRNEKKLEAEARMTDVQTRSWNREVAESA